MSTISGEKSVEIDAPITTVWRIAADIEKSPSWQGSLREVDVRETDAAGRASLVDMINDGKVRSFKSTMRFDYDEPDGMRWKQESGDLKHVEGSWRFEELAPGRTRATYALAVDPGMMIGMLLRGPVADQVKVQLLGDAAAGLKREAEAAG